MARRTFKRVARPQRDRRAVRKGGVRGYMWGALLVVAIMALSLLLTLRYVMTNVHSRNVCHTNLQQIYRTLGLYEIDQGELPSLSFFPRDPKTDKDSLKVVLEGYGLKPENLVCPDCPKRLKDDGLTYLWNPRLNGKQLFVGEQPEWMVVEIQAISDEVAGPHFRGFHVLYTDGTIEHTDRVPPGVRSRDESERSVSR